MDEVASTVRLALVDAFTDEPLAGNAAGVVPEADGLTDGQMQAVARELAVSETAFLRPSDRADRRARYFTPTREVDLCGHATVAAHAHLFEEGDIDAGDHRLETNVGVLDVEVEPSGTVWLTGDRPSVDLVDLDYDRTAGALGVPEVALSEAGRDLPAAVASVGLKVLVVPVTYLEHLGNAAPDSTAVETLADEYGAAGVYAFTFDTLDPDATLHGRFFAPGYGIAEDPVTGTASGACGAYLRHVDAFEAMPDELRLEQGHFVDRPGVVRVRVGHEVRIGGRAVTALRGSMVVPGDDGDDIIEA